MTETEIVGCRKIVNRKHLRALSDAARSGGQRIVLTNGCFDILHVGHVRYLQRARNLGDVLIVGVNDDGSVRRLKGDGRPVNSANDRAEVLAALECVDVVTIFEEDTASELAAEVRPNVYVKGGDYSDDERDASYPVEGRIVSRYGGAVRVIAFEPGFSTSHIIHRLRDQTG